MEAAALINTLLQQGATGPAILKPFQRFFENLRQWEADHPHDGPVVSTAEELRQQAAEKDRERAEASSLALKEESPSKALLPPPDGETGRAKS